MVFYVTCSPKVLYNNNIMYFVPVIVAVHYLRYTQAEETLMYILVFLYAMVTSTTL